MLTDVTVEEYMFLLKLSEEGWRLKHLKKYSWKQTFNKHFI